MGIVANVRVNTQVPFPAQVTAIGPITIAKKNSVWIVSLSIANLGTQLPPLANYGTDFVLVWDSVAQTYFKMPLNGFSLSGRPQRSITASGNLPITNSDNILNINAATDLTPTIPLASSRGGSPLTFKNLPGSHSQTLTRTSPDEFDGSNTYVLAAGASVTLVPYNDGVNSGWAIE